VKKGVYIALGHVGIASGVRKDIEQEKEMIVEPVFPILEEGNQIVIMNMIEIVEDCQEGL
jgi:hypothetical protein